MKAIILARVSTEEQMKEGQSIPAQLERAREYCNRKELKIVSEYPFEESSTKDQRSKFDKVIEEIEDSKEKIALIVETVDRLQRSFKESVLLDDLRKEDKLEIHFIREGLTVHKDSNSSDLLRWDMGVMFARSYVLQLSDNVKRSIEQKLRNGELPGRAYIGYKNITLENEKKDIVPDKERDFLIRKAFELYATGNYSMKKLAVEMGKRGLTNNFSGKPIPTSQIERILKEPFYYGVMRYNGKLYPHRYETIISKHLFDSVQEVINGYNRQNFKRTNKPYVFRGLVKCDKCGCAISPEIKKGKYVYYHCTNYHGNCDNVVWIKEEDLLKQIEPAFRSLKLTPEAIEKLKVELRAIHESEEEYYKKNVEALKRKLETTDHRMKVMYQDRLDGRITTDMYDKMIEKYQSERQDLLIQYEEHTKADKDFYITANKILSISQRAFELFQSSEPQEKTQLLGFLLQNFSLKGKKLLFELKIPFTGIVEYAKSGSMLAKWNDYKTLDWVKIYPNLEYCLEISNELLTNYSK